MNKLIIWAVLALVACGGAQSCGERPRIVAVEEARDLGKSFGPVINANCTRDLDHDGCNNKQVFSCSVIYGDKSVRTFHCSVKEEGGCRVVGEWWK